MYWPDSKRAEAIKIILILVIYPSFESNNYLKPYIKEKDLNIISYVQKPMNKCLGILGVFFPPSFIMFSFFTNIYDQTCQQFLFV